MNYEKVSYISIIGWPIEIQKIPQTIKDWIKKKIDNRSMPRKAIESVIKKFFPNKRLISDRYTTEVEQALKEFTAILLKLKKWRGVNFFKYIL